MYNVTQAGKMSLMSVASGSYIDAVLLHMSTVSFSQSFKHQYT